jgi:predicted enzyme related to lactoylglutathione lyase
MILGLRTAAYHVPPDKLAEATEWYAKVAGVRPYFEEPFYVGFNVGGFELGLVPDGGEPGPGGAVPYWGVPEVGAEVARLAALGAKVVKPAEDVGGGIKVATLADPYGNLLGLIENPHFDPAAVR